MEPITPSFALSLILGFCTTQLCSSSSPQPPPPKLTAGEAAFSSTFSHFLSQLSAILTTSPVFQEAFRSIENADVHVWPALRFSWWVVLGTVIGFLGAALGTAGGVGGGSIFVPMLRLVLGFDPKTSTSLSKCMIMGAAAAAVSFNFRQKHPIQNSSIIDYDLALLLQPMLLLGISIGVAFNVIFPNWIVSLLLVFIFAATSVRVLRKGVATWKRETIQMKVSAICQVLTVFADLFDDCTKVYDNCTWSQLKLARYQRFIITKKRKKGNSNNLSPDRNDSILDPVSKNKDWRRIFALLFLWMCFLIFQILKNFTPTCSGRYWILNILQIPVAVSGFLIEAISLYKRSKRKNESGIAQPSVCSAAIDWRIPQLVLSAASGLVAGVVGGLLGLGGGFVLGPLLLEFGVHPQVYSATATFVMLFSSSLSVIEYHLLHRFPVPFALYLIVISMLGGYSGQFVINKLVDLLGRASIITFLLAALNFASAWTLGGIGIAENVMEWKRGDYMGLLNLCHES